MSGTSSPIANAVKRSSDAPKAKYRGPLVRVSYLVRPNVAHDQGPPPRERASTITA